MNYKNSYNGQVITEDNYRKLQPDQRLIYFSTTEPENYTIVNNEANAAASIIAIETLFGTIL